MPAERALSPAARASQAPDPSRVLVIGCGALARELVAVIDQAGLTNVDLTCLPATLHNRPGGIPAAVRAKIRAARPRYERIFVAYADCGTGGLLDLALADEGVERLPGAHCYELYAGSGDFAAITDEDPATFFLTDFLARNFDRLVISGLGLDRHPELLPAYFGNYHRLVYLAQTDDATLVTTARRAARRLGLAFELRRTGYGDLATGLAAAAASATLVERSGAALAPSAPNVSRGTSMDARRVDSLHVPQPRDRRSTSRAESLHEMHEAKESEADRRQFVHSTQRLAGDVHGMQRQGSSGANHSPSSGRRAAAASGTH